MVAELMNNRVLKLQRSFSHECTDEYQLYQLDLMDGEHEYDSNNIGPKEIVLGNK